MSPDDISLREHFEILMARDREALEKALELQAREYERRLDDLNHEAERLTNMQNNYVHQEVYEQYKESVNLELRKLREYRSVQEGRAQAFTVVTGIVAVFGSVVVSTIVSFIHH
jgi:hypothetical protein